MRLFLPLLLLASLAASGLALLRPELSDILLLAAPVALASGWLWLTSLRHRPAFSKRKQDPAKRLVIDGSNVMYWRDNTPKLETVIELITLLQSKGYQIGVIFDASAGHVLFGRYLDDAPLAKMLGITPEECFVVPSGTVADEYILQAARDLGARIVTNDRYRDWADQFPEARQKGHLIQGRYEKGTLTLHRLAPPRSKTA